MGQARQRTMVRVMNDPELLKTIAHGYGDRPLVAWKELVRRARAKGERVAECHLVWLTRQNGVPMSIKKEAAAMRQKEEVLDMINAVQVA